ncbi:23S rRNA (uracil(1939)-C(5))-methyltransferase RlmD [Dendrosporobacter sp. 1207_IL3150]|uniref:23S rRNA (uracil(1939)-C(5))-methyltransferase RlmD n=1 Tax=Dendrosporobacter sp. 1207_IL3150 TaxID=3084054 RepID=UPI002FD98AD5
MINEIPVIKGKEYPIDILSLGHSGEGVGRYKDFTVFVPYALPGEQVQAKIIEVKKNYAKGKLISVINPSEERNEPECSLYQRCGGCQMQHMSYSAQLKAKRQQVVDAVTRIGKLSDVTVHPTIGADSPWYYRNKMQFPVGTVNNNLVIGCFEQGTHSIVNTENCLIQHEANNTIAQQARIVLSELGISAYNERTGEGVVRHVLGRVGNASGEVMVVLVTATDGLPRKAQIIDQLKNKIPGIVSIIQNVNSRKTNVILGNKTTTLWGKDTITDKLGEFSFNISARSFFQVNTVQAEVLYNKAVEYAGLNGHETVIDAYCGTGTITLFLARKAKKVIGIEIVEPAIKDANANAERNGITNTEFIVGDAIDVMPKLFKEGIRPDTIVVDPPRAGCERIVLETFVNMQPERIVYVSCNPASLARDLAVLNEHGYKTVEVQPVDMFPQTFHVECVALIERE